MARSKHKEGFVYLWYDRKHKRYYVGSHWGTENDGYICSSTWMKQAYFHRPEDFKRRILKRITTSRQDLLDEEYRYLQMIKPEEMKRRYYNPKNNKDNHWHSYPENVKTIGQKISYTNKGRDLIGENRTPEIGKKISAAKKGVKFSAEHVAKLAESHKGKKQSAEANAKRSESLKRAYAEGKRKPAEYIPLTSEQNAEKGRKISEALSGKSLSEEHKAKIAAAGFGTHWKGKIRSEETKVKMAEARRLYWEKKKHLNSISPKDGVQQPTLQDRSVC